MTEGLTQIVLPLAFAVGGGLGAVARYLLSSAVKHEFPYATLLVNVSGCFALGFVLAFAWNTPGALSAEGRLLFAGFCGGFTTFSSFAYQSLDLHRRHSLRHAAVNVAASVVFCVVAFLCGRFVGGLTF